MKHLIIKALLCVSMIGLAGVYIAHINQKGSFSYASYDMCEHRRLIDISLKYGADYLLDNRFESPAIQIIADKTLLKLIQDKFHSSYLVATHSSAQHCHLKYIKYHTAHINHKLTRFIPDDVDYVSYAPPHINEDKAVYCYYYFSNQPLNTPKANSSCYFIHLKDERLIKDDISELERLNLQLITKNNTSFFNPLSRVDEWHNKQHLFYGIYFATYTNNQRFGYGAVY